MEQKAHTASDSAKMSTGNWGPAFPPAISVTQLPIKAVWVAFDANNKLALSLGEVSYHRRIVFVYPRRWRQTRKQNDALSLMTSTSRLVKLWSICFFTKAFWELRWAGSDVCNHSKPSFLHDFVLPLLQPSSKAEDGNTKLILFVGISLSESDWKLRWHGQEHRNA